MAGISVVRPPLRQRRGLLNVPTVEAFERTLQTSDSSSLGSTLSLGPRVNRFSLDLLDKEQSGGCSRGVKCRKYAIVDRECGSWVMNDGANWYL